MKSIKLYLLFFFITFGIIINLSANPVDKNRAKRIAKNFYSQQMSDLRFPGIQSYELIKYKGINTFYAFNIKNQKGFILVAADDASIPVLGYSFSGAYSSNEQPENFALTLEDYNRQLEYIIKNNISANAYIIAQWEKYNSSNNIKGSTTSVAPLLTSIWSQGCYYNNETPTDAAGPCGHVVTGCVATAMAQVLYYYQFPAKGSGRHNYNSNYGLLTAVFDTTNYNWSAMTDTLTSQSSSQSVDAVATLISHCGIAVNMQYSAGSSGAYSQDAANAFNHYFNYDNGLQLLHKVDYSDSIWEQMLRAELDSLHPLYYDGSGTGAHAFVCDGYQNNNYFHFNWGWSGNHNGYFLVSALNPGGMNFSNYCGAVFNMKPGVPTNCSGITDTLVAKAGNISDGSYGQDYQNGANCKWLISPAAAVAISLEFYTFNLLAGDSLFVYDGSDSTATLIGAFSSNTLPTSLASSNGQMFIQFVTDNQNTTSGWSAYYRSEYCDGLKIYSNLTGTINDGSGTENYNDNTNCYWLITDTANNPINLEFTLFQTEQSFDFVDVYDGNSTSSNQLGSFSGNQLPQLLTSTGGMMLIHFHSDGGVTDEGWEANYYNCGQPQAPYASDSAFFCSNDSVMLIIPNNVDSFVWVENGIANSSITSKQFAVKQAGTYSYLTYSNFCPTTSSDTIVVIENPLPQIDLGADTIICDNHSLQLIADSGFVHYQWSTGDTSLSISVDASTGLNQNIELVITDSNLCSNSDILNIQFVDCTGLDESVDLSFELFPNPSQEYIQVKLAQMKALVEVYIFDASGQKVIYQKARNTNHIRINTSQLAAGMYYVEVIHKDLKIKKSFIKQ